MRQGTVLCLTPCCTEPVAELSSVSLNHGGSISPRIAAVLYRFQARRLQCLDEQVKHSSKMRGLQPFHPSENDYGCRFPRFLQPQCIGITADGCTGA